MRRLILSSAFLGLAAAAGSAQAQVTPGWSAFAGCWTPVAADGSRNVAANTPRVCIVPDAANGAELVTIVLDSVTERTRIDASGQRREVSKQGCAGWESAEFSSDGRRLYLRGEQTCASGVKRLTSGIFAIATDGDWISAVNAGADSSSSVRVTRYATAALAAPVPAEIRDALLAREMSDRTGRSAAQRDVSVDAVIEANRLLSAPAIEAWLSELEQDFDLDEQKLVKLADAGVQPSVIDMMVAVSNPKVFSVQATGAGYETVENDSARVRRSDRYAPCFAPVVDPWAWYAYDPCDPYLRYGYYRSRYYRYGYGYDPYYGYGRYDGYYGRPAIIVVGSTGGSDPIVNRGRGRMTKDGYKRDPATTSGSTGSSTSRGTSSEASRGESSRSSGDRTATRKPPSGESRSSGDDRGATKSSAPKESSGESKPASSGSSSSGRTATRKPPA